jgi:hypothetical protein
MLNPTNKRKGKEMKEKRQAMSSSLARANKEVGHHSTYHMVMKST